MGRKYMIDYYDAYKILEEGVKEKKNILSCNKEITDYVRIGSRERENCLLYDQIFKEFPNLNPNMLSEILIILDFSANKSIDGFMDIMKIKLNIKGKDIIFVDYLKSNSMSKESYLYFINEEYKERINKRISFDFDNTPGIALSKWYAYSGLCLSDCTILDSEDLKIGKDEICVIPDESKEEKINCITAISVSLLIDKMIDILDSINNQRERIIKDPKGYEDYDFEPLLIDEMIKMPKVANIYNEIMCYKKSKDFKNLSDLLREIIDFILEQKDNPLDVAQEAFDKKINNYNDIDYKSNTIKWERIYVENYLVKINFFDGEGLIDMDFANKINKYLNNNEISINDEDDYNENDDNESNDNQINSFQIRLPFIKGIVHSCDFKSFFKEKGITKIKGKFKFDSGVIKDYDVDKIKIILTESQFKAASFLKRKGLSVDHYFNILQQYDYQIGISGVEPKQKTKVRLNYQFLSTLPFENPSDIDYLTKENVERLNKMTSDESVFEALKLEDKLFSMHNDERFNPNPSGYYLYELAPNFYTKTQKFKRKRDEIYREEKKNLTIGRLQTDGVRKYLATDLLRILYKAGNLKLKFNDNIKDIDKYGFYAPNTNLNSECIVLRNPHYSRNEITILKNCNDMNKDGERSKYFGHLTGVVMVNPTSLTAERLGGADYDGDTVCILNDNQILYKVKSKIINGNKHIYPIVKIPSISQKPSLNIKSNNKLSDIHKRCINCLSNTFSSFTGQISNYAFMKTLDAYNSNDDNKMEEIAFYTVLGGLEIDSSKNGKKPNLDIMKSNKYNDDTFIQIKDVYRNRSRNYNVNTNMLYKKINEQADKSALYYNFYEISKDKMNDISNEELMEIKKSDNINLDAVAVIQAYKTLMYSYKRMKDAIGLRKNRSDKPIDKQKSREIILKELFKFIQINNYALDVNILISKFKGISIEQYLETNYHFLMNKEKRIEVLESLNCNLSRLELEMLSDFNNNGYKNLYYCIYYNKLDVIPVYKDYIPINYGSSLPNFSNLNLSNDDRKYVTSKIKMIIDDTVNQINKTNIIRNSMILGIVNNTLNKYTYNIKFEDVSRLIDVYRNDIVFSIFYDAAINYFKEGNYNE